MASNQNVASVSAPVPRSGLAALSLGALGIVYGDIGTSPLYTMRETFAGPHVLAIDRGNVLGALSLLFWSVMIVVSIKYVSVMMRADNRGEGGTLVLFTLVERAASGRKRLLAAVGVIGIIGASLFYGDSMITPAISVLSAVEGLKIAAPHLEPWIVPLTLAILIVLFTIQRHGTGAIGGLFGPVMMLWFLTLAVIGIHGISHHPAVLLGLSPHYAVMFILHNKLAAFLALGSVFLAVTGAEALYTDMGHFGKKPIRLAWYLIVLPSLMLNYLGQGALLLDDPHTIDNPFFRLAPAWASIPLVILATTATIIASQAVVSGAFSLTRQAVNLGYVPRFRTIHTSESERGQIYIPFVNWSLLAFVVVLVIGFGSSSNLAAAYGVAVSGTFVLDTVLLQVVVLLVWRWRLRWALALTGVFFVVDLAFFFANSTKIPDGGWFPLVVAIAVFAFLTTWKRGSEALDERIRREMSMSEFLQSLSARIARVPGIAVFLTGSTDSVPPALRHNLKHNKVLHERNILLTVAVSDEPEVAPERRIEAEDLGQGFRRIVLRYGFMENVDVPKALANAPLDTLGFVYEPMSISYFLSRETLLPATDSALPFWRQRLFFWMHRVSIGTLEFFQLPKNRVVELGSQVEL